jgi:hypothetical protein
LDFRLRHLGVAPALLVLRGGRRRDQRRVHDGAAAQQFALGREMLRNGREDRLRQLTPLEQVAEVKDRGLVKLACYTITAPGMASRPSSRPQNARIDWMS